MEAKDTVMDYGQTKVIVDELLAEKTTADRVSLLRTEFEAQAEISFKAGIKEVVEWIESRGGNLDGCREMWQAKLKEWGITD